MDDIELFDALDGRQTVRQLHKAFPKAEARLAEWSSLGLVKWLPPVPEEGTRLTRVLVFEPHMDDAALSIGGSLMRLRTDATITIVSMVKWSAFTSYDILGRQDFGDIENVTNLRVTESRLVARFLNGDHVDLGEIDGPLLPLATGEQGWPAPSDRQNDENATRRRQWAAAQELGIGLDHKDEIAVRLGQVVESVQPDQVWFPLGLAHFDHIRARRAALLWLKTAPQWKHRCQVHVYKEVPYHMKHYEAAERLVGALNRLGYSVEEHTEDISDVYREKLELLSLYASQWKIEKMAPQIPRTECYCTLLT